MLTKTTRLFVSSVSLLAGAELWTCPTALAQCTPSVLSRIGGAADQIAARGTLGFLALPGELLIVDIANPANPVPLGHVFFPGSAEELEITPNYAYIAADDAGLIIVDISVPATPVIEAIVDIEADDVAVSGGTAFVVSGIDVVVVDVSNPASPVVAATIQPGFSFARAVASSGNTVYIGTTGDILSYDATNPAAPVFLDSVALPSVVEELAFRGTTLAAALVQGVSIVDCANPAALTLSTTVDASEIVHNVAIVPNGATPILAYRGLHGDIRLRDIANPGVLLATIDSAWPDDLAGVDGTLLFTDGPTSFAYDITTPTTPVLLHSSTRSPTYPSAIATVGLHTIVAAGWDLLVYNGVDPAAPALVTTFPVGSSVYAFATSGRFGYAATFSGDLVVIDLINPAAPTIRGSINLGSSLDALLLSGDTLFVHGYFGAYGIAAVDVSDPDAPTLLDTLEIPGWSYDVDMATDGGTLYVGSYGVGVDVVDVSDPSNLGSIVRYAEDPLNRYEGLALHPDGRSLFVIEGASINLYDATDPADVTRVASFPSTTTPGPTHLEMIDSLLLVSSYLGGLSYVDVANPAAPVVLGSTNLGGEVDRFSLHLGTLWGGGDGSGVWALNAPRFPRVVTPPVAADRCGNSPLEFSVGWASATAPSFQWLRNGANLTDGPGFGGSTLSGTTTNHLTITNPPLIDPGLYSVQITNTCGSVTSAGVPINARLPVNIVIQPSDLEVCSMGSGTLDFGFLGTLPVEFQWQFESPAGSGTFVDLVDETRANYRISGANARQLTIEARPGRRIPPSVAGEYRCVASNMCGEAITNPATVTIVSCCGSADFDGDGDSGTDADIEAFFACLAGSCCGTCSPDADFNGDGDVGTDADIEAYFRVLAGGSC